MPQPTHHHPHHSSKNLLGPSLLVGCCRTLKQLRSAHAQATTLGLLQDPSPDFSKLLYAFTRLDPLPPPASIHYALSLFRRIHHPSTFPHNLLIRAHTLLSSPLPALRVFVSMRRLSLPPDLHTFPFALKACAHLLGGGDADGHRLGRALHSQAVKFGFGGDEFVSNTLISVYANSPGSVGDVQRLFDQSPHRDVVSYNTLIDGYVKAGEMAHARKIFDDMPVRDVVSYGTLLAGYSRSNRCEEALQLFDSLLASGIRPDDVALVAALSACAQLGALDRGKGIHNYIAQHRTRPNVFLSTGLVDMYAKCGCIDTAREVFERCPRKNLFTWNAIIAGLGMHGHGHLSLAYFNRMQAAGVRPDGVTLLGVLIGCTHAGLIDTARKLFDDMVGVHGVERELKHYGCMSDMLGRAGLIEEAMEMIEGMPVDGDEYVWGGVLGGCRIHGNVEVAEIAAAHLLEINPDDSGIYSVLANMYGSARRWEDVSRIRRLMDERKVRKNVGCSSIQVDRTHGMDDGSALV